MAWTAPTDRLTGDVITAAQWNTFLGLTGDMSMTAAAKVTTNGDIVYATAANTLARLGIGSTAQVLTVSGGIPSWATAATPAFFDLLQTAFRTPRKLLALFTTVPVATTFDAATYINDKPGVGFVHTNSTSSLLSLGTPTSLLLESYTAQVSGATGTDMYSGGVSAGNVFFASTAPNKNPRMSIRWFPGASDANLSRTFAGFVAAATNPGAATASGAYLQAATTGNLFFHTRQGGTATTTDLGARPTALTSYEIETTDAGVTWTCRNVTTSTVVATHTTNVPTATVAIAYYIGGTSGSGSLPTHNVSYCEVESNTVA